MRVLNTTYFYLLAIVISLLVLGNGSVYAQRSWDPDRYFGIPKRDKQDVFFDEFENNMNSWDLGSLHLKERIQDGDFYCANLTSHSYPKVRQVSMNQSGNYEIEIRIRYVKGADRSMTGLSFGRDVRGNEYNFFFNSRGSFKISKYNRNRTQDYQPWKPTKALSKYSYNSLMVRKVSDKWYFFINEEFVAQMKAKPLFGNEFGFIIGGNMAVEVDFLRVAEILTVDNMGPQISLMEPNLGNSQSAVLNERRQSIKGKVFDVSGISSFTINGKPISVSKETGEFSASLILPDGITPIEIVTKDRFENISQKKFYMEYIPKPVAFTPPPAKSSSLSYLNASSAPSTRSNGKNYLFVIGVNNYTKWNRLHNAVKDCQDIANTLTAYYHFDRENVISLYNEEATRENILETLETLQETIRPEDNLLIYYAGHGYYDDQSKLGYWVPVHARLNKIPDFIRNSTIHDYLRTIGTKHTFLIADACYAGSLFAHNRGNLKLDARSRWAFTSGSIEKVWDGQPGQNSPFARYLIKFLKSNTKKELQADELINVVSSLVQRNTAQSPQGDPLRNVGDEGGIFIFERK